MFTMYSRKIKLTGIISSSSELVVADDNVFATTVLFFLVFSLCPNETVGVYQYKGQEGNAGYIHFIEHT